MSDLFDKLAAEETAFFSSRFFSPVLKGNPVRVRIVGIIVALQITKPKNFQGWGVFEPTSHKEAKFIRDPNLKEKQEYFKLFPGLRLILCRHTDNDWFGIPARKADTRFHISGTVPVFLTEETQMFDTVIVRFDGNVCWFEQVDPKSNPKVAPYLRESLNTLLEPDKVDLLGISQEERDAYFMAYGPAVESSAEAKKSREEKKIRNALERAGASYQSHIERDKTYTIEYIVDGDRHRSVIDKSTLRVESSGICLSGGDRNFDLQSLVGVLIEAKHYGKIVRTNII
jgi:hypothetical protein